MKALLLLALTLCLLVAGEPAQTPQALPARTISIADPTPPPSSTPTWTTLYKQKRADSTEDSGDSTDDSNTATEATETADAATSAETTAETTAESTSESSTETTESTSSETSSSETTSSETTSSETSTSSETTSSTTSSSSSSSSTTSTSTATSTVSPEIAERNRVGNIAAIAVFSSLGGIIAIVFIALAIRKRILRRRKAEKKALLQAGSSAYSMVPVSDEAAASNGEVKYDRLSMMFANDPKPHEQGQGVQVNATPLLTPQQAAQQGYPQAYPQYPQGYPHQI